jgi:hypothetical protein
LAGLRAVRVRVACVCGSPLSLLWLLRLSFLPLFK